jgi:predicted TIM-barrel fold metal-dependent hydrolase
MTTETLPPLPPRKVDIHNHLWSDPTGDKRVAEMDRFGVEVTLILAVPPIGQDLGANVDVLSAWRRHPQRLVPGVYLDPRQGAGAIAELRRYHAAGVRVVKLFPNFGYYPDDDACRPFFDAVEELGLGVLSHCGWLAPSPGLDSAAYYSHPGRFELVVRRHPRTPFIMAHLGGIAGYLETVMLTTRAPNVYTDTAPGQGLLVLRRGGPMAGAVPPEKLMFACDEPDLGGYLPKYQQALADQGYGPHFDKIFYANARAWLENLGAWPK